MSGKKIMWIVAGVVAVAAIAAALSAESGSVEAYGEVAVAGEGLPRYEAGAADPAVGMPAPSITGETQSVMPGGTPKIVLFLAHWCPHCQREVPRLTSWVDANGMPDGFELIGVATSSTPTAGNFPPSIWLERERFPFPVIYDDEDGTAAVAYGLSAFPFWVVIDSDGNVAQRFTGELPSEAAIDQLFASARDL
ncbi:MAG TPA: TlpA disulfide reductase family protein [Acidimicrobiia bacterium]|nr:TlpA disulfide reductase family protein [Acidimicrobiia bacterium]